MPVDKSCSCDECGEDRAYKFDRNSRGYPFLHCRDCYAKLDTVAASKSRHRDYNKAHVYDKYDMTRSEVYALSAKQGHVCAICGKPQHEGKGKKLHVDHDHITGKVRGLLCMTCNVALGGFKDSPELLLKAVEYLGQNECTKMDFTDKGPISQTGTKKA